MNGKRNEDMGDKIKLLVVDDEQQFLEALCKRLEFRDFEVTPVGNGAEAIEAARKERFDVALIDLKMPGIEGEELFSLLKEEDPFLEVIILTGHGSIDSAIRSTKQGIFSYLHKPCPLDTLLHVLMEAHQSRVKKINEYNEKNIKGTTS
jgi:DNA-binding NtrC family response regulator